jgi:hypothetical protein
MSISDVHIRVRSISISLRGNTLSDHERGIDVGVRRLHRTPYIHTLV